MSKQECPICLDELGSKNIVTTECGHKFHFSCLVTSMKNSNACPLCRGVIDPEPRVGQQLEDLTYEEVEDLEYSITELTGRNQQTSRDIMNYIASQMGPVRGESSLGLTDSMEVGVRGIITNYVSEIVHDFVHILAEFNNSHVENDNTLPVLDLPINIIGDIYSPEGSQGEILDSLSATEGVDVRDTSTPERPITPVRVPVELQPIDQLPDDTIRLIDCIINTNFDPNETNFLNELPEFQIINNHEN